MNRLLPTALCLAALACESGVGGPRAPSVTVPSRESHDAFFPIAAGPHAADCSTCHGAADSFKQFDCLTCHAQGVTTNGHAGVTGFQYASPDCLACHPRGTSDSAAAAQNHGASFPIGASDSHTYGKAVTVQGAPRTIACGSCHVDPANRPNVDCTGCHLQTGSAGTGQSPTVDLTTAHAGKVGATGASGAPHNLWLGSGPVGGGGGASAKCVLCHSDDAHLAGTVAAHGQASAATGHAVFDIGAGNANHFVSCDLCHTATATSAARMNPELDFGRASCDACHAATGAQSVAADHAGFGQSLAAPYNVGDPNNAAACLTCHPTGGSAAFSHAWFPIAAGEKHSSAVAKCADCHSTQASYSGDPSANLQAITCTKCHDDSAGNKANQGGVTTTAAHQAARVGKDIWDVPGGLDYANNALCLRCHAGNIADPAIAAFSTKLVFRLAQHDAHCSLRGKNLISGDTTHNVNHNTDSTTNPLPRCFGCHDSLATGTATPWATDWSIGRQSPPAPALGCKNCHEHASNGSAPSVTCQ